MAELHWVDGVRGASVPADDRGLLYGDGVFRTLRVDGGQVDDLAGQLEHLRDDAAQLDLPVVAHEVLAREVVAAAAATENGIVRVTLTRGSGGHGYSPAGANQGRRMIVGRALVLDAKPQHLALLPPRPLRSVFSGKHLNRLPQVLAAIETPAWASSGLMQDSDSRLVCATQSNIFAIDEAGNLITPPDSDGAMLGRMRARVLAAAPSVGLKCVERSLHVDSLRRLQGLVCVGSVRGLQWVHTVSDLQNQPLMQWDAPPPTVRQLQAAISHPAH